MQVGYPLLLIALLVVVVQSLRCLVYRYTGNCTERPCFATSSAGEREKR